MYAHANTVSGGANNTCSALSAPPSPFTYLKGRGGEVLTLRAHDLHVQVCQPTGDGQCQPHHALHCHRAPVQVVEQGPLLVVLGDEPQLGPGPVICQEDVRWFSFIRNVTEKSPPHHLASTHPRGRSGWGPSSPRALPGPAVPALGRRWQPWLGTSPALTSAGTGTAGPSLRQTL